MRLIACALISALMSGAAAAQPAAEDWARYPAATEVQLRDVAAIVRITPQARQDVALAMVNPGPLPNPDLRIARNRLIVDGAQRRVRSCHGSGDDFSVTVRNGRLRADQLPIIEIRVPEAAVVSASGGVRLHMGPAQSANVTFTGCGEAEVEAVANEADITVAGAGTLKLYHAGSARIAIAGAGDVEVGAILNGLTASIAGAGDLAAARVDGPTNLAVQGAGDVLIRDGQASVLTVVIAGAGDVVHNGRADRLDATIVGAGDVRVREVRGEINRRVLGGGEVIVSERQ